MASFTKLLVAVILFDCYCTHFRSTATPLRTTSLSRKLDINRPRTTDTVAVNDSDDDDTTNYPGFLKKVTNFLTGIFHWISGAWASISDAFAKLTTGEIVGIIIIVIICILTLLCCCCCLESCRGCCRWYFVLVAGSLALGISFFATPVAIIIATSLGFTAAGVAASSCASGAQSFRGNVRVGSIFAGMQSFGARYERI